MQPVADGLVYIVDDDSGVREALAWLLRSRRVSSEAYAGGQAFLDMLAQYYRPQQAACLVLDMRMPGLSGLQVFESLLARDLLGLIPTIFLTGHADVPTAVDTVKRGAFDFCEKPFSDNTLVDRIFLALAASQKHIDQHHRQDALAERLKNLTDREREIMHLIYQGLPNKVIADQFQISVRTVEVHRARVFEKLDVKSALELAKLVLPN